MYIVPANFDTYDQMEINHKTGGKIDSDRLGSSNKKASVIEDVMHYIENNTRGLNMDPSFIHLSRDNKAAFCDLMPLSRFPINIEKSNAKNLHLKQENLFLILIKFFNTDDVCLTSAPGCLKTSYNLFVNVLSAI